MPGLSSQTLYSLFPIIWGETLRTGVISASGSETFIQNWKIVEIGDKFGSYPFYPTLRPEEENRRKGFSKKKEVSLWLHPHNWKLSVIFTLLIWEWEANRFLGPWQRLNCTHRGRERERGRARSFHFPSLSHPPSKTLWKRLSLFPWSFGVYIKRRFLFWGNRRITPFENGCQNYEEKDKTWDFLWKNNGTIFRPLAQTDTFFREF